MELVNRETNFNKVFSADPKVGILNPLTVRKVDIYLFVTKCTGKCVTAAVVLLKGLSINQSYLNALVTGLLHNNNNNNNLICIAPACRMTSEALADSLNKVKQLTCGY